MNLYTIIIKDCGEDKFGAIHEMLIDRWTLRKGVMAE